MAGERAAVGVDVECAGEVRAEVGENVDGFGEEGTDGKRVHGGCAVRPLTERVDDLRTAEWGRNCVEQ